MHRSILAAVLALITPAAVGQVQNRPPNIDLARAVEDQTIAIRLFSTAENDTISRGSGFLIGKFDDHQDAAKDSLTFATAAHVIDGHDLPGVRVEIRYRDQNRWVPATVQLQTERSADLAVISAPRREAAVDRGRPRVIPSTPHPGRGQDAWVFGYNPANDQLEWRRLLITNDGGGTVELVGRGLESGFSGGPIVNQIGRLGLIQSRGAAGESHRGISTDTMATILNGKNIAHTLDLNQVVAALLNAQRKGLAAALFCIVPNGRDRHGQFWAAIDLNQDTVKGEFTGVFITGKPPGGDPRIRMSPSQGGLLAVFDQPIGWAPLKVESREFRLEVDAKVAIRGHLVLRGEAGNDVVYLAIPTGGSELLPARALLSSRARGQQHAEVRVWTDSNILSHPSTLLAMVENQIVPFSVIPIEHRKSLEIPFSIQRDRSLGGAVTVSGLWRVPDVIGRAKANFPEEWTVGAAPVAMSPSPFRLGKAGQPFEITLAAETDGRLVFFVDRRSGKDIGGDQVLIVGPVISYEALEVK